MRSESLRCVCCDNGAGFLFLLCVIRVLLGVTGLRGQALPRPHRASYSHYVYFGCTSFRVSGPFSWLGTDRLRYLLAASRHLLSLRRECCLWLWCPVTFAQCTQHLLRLFATCELIFACRSIVASVALRKDRRSLTSALPVTPSIFATTSAFRSESVFLSSHQDARYRHRGRFNFVLALPPTYRLSCECCVQLRTAPPRPRFGGSLTPRPARCHRVHPR